MTGGTFHSRNKLVSFEPSTTTTILPVHDDPHRNVNTVDVSSGRPFRLYLIRSRFPKYQRTSAFFPVAISLLREIRKHVVSDTRYHRTNPDHAAAKACALSCFRAVRHLALPKRNGGDTCGQLTNIQMYLAQHVQCAASLRLSLR